MNLKNDSFIHSKTICTQIYYFYSFIILMFHYIVKVKCSHFWQINYHLYKHSFTPNTMVKIWLL